MCPHCSSIIVFVWLFYQDVVILDRGLRVIELCMAGQMIVADCSYASQIKL